MFKLLVFTTSFGKEFHNLLTIARVTTFCFEPGSYHLHLIHLSFCTRRQRKKPLFPVLSLFFRLSYISNLSLCKMKRPSLRSPVSTPLPKANETAEKHIVLSFLLEPLTRQCTHIKYFVPNHINSITLSLGL